MNNRTRHIVAVTIVAAALCADRAVAAAPALRTPITSSARRFATRLTTSLRHTVPAMRLHQSPLQQSDNVPTMVLSTAPLPVLHSTDATPFRFRLPPPIA